MTIDPALEELARHILRSYTASQIGQLMRMIAPVSPCALMGADEFERVMVILRGQSGHRAFSDRSVAAARLVLVMGASVSEAAAEIGLSRQAVHSLMTRIRSRLEGLPADWVRVEAWLPPAAADEIIQRAQSLRTAHASPIMSTSASDAAVRID